MFGLFRKAKQDEIYDFSDELILDDDGNIIGKYNEDQDITNEIESYSNL